MSTTVIALTQQIETGMQLYPLHSPTHVLPWLSREASGGWATNTLFIAEHAGTHLDAPFHLVPEGKTVDQLELDRMTGPAVALDLHDKWPKGIITADDLEAAIRDVDLRAGDAVVLRTGADVHLGEPEYLTSYGGLSADGTAWLVDKGARLVGTDAASIDHAESEEFPAHRGLLPAGVLIVENLANLAELVAVAGTRRFALHTFPLKISGGTGSPIRAVAVVDE